MQITEVKVKRVKLDAGELAKMSNMVNTKIHRDSHDNIIIMIEVSDHTVLDKLRADMKLKAEGAKVHVANNTVTVCWEEA